MQDKDKIEELGLGSDYNKKLSRVLAGNEHEAGNYWKRENSYTGQLILLIVIDQCLKSTIFQKIISFMEVKQANMLLCLHYYVKKAKGGSIPILALHTRPSMQMSGLSLFLTSEGLIPKQLN